MPDLLLGVRVKIDRAKKHLADLDAAVRSFLARNPYGVRIERDPQSEYERYYFVQSEVIPADWGAIVGDCVHNLRSSLDLLANALVIHNGGAPNVKYTKFPISSASIHVDSDIASGISGASAKAKKIVARLKPYNDGNDNFWRLHQIDIIDKHRLLIPVAAAHEKFGVRWNVKQAGTDHYPAFPMLTGPTIDRRFPLYDGDVLLAYRRATTDDVQDETEFHFTFDVAFGDGQIFDGEPVLETLNKLVDFTERVVAIFDRHIFK